MASYYGSHETKTFAQREKHEAKTAREQQDVVLGDIEKGLGRLKDQAGSIGDELADHNNMLRDIGDSMDGTEEEIVIVTGKVQRLLAKSKQWCKCVPYGIILAEICIVFLLVMILVLG